MRPMILKKVEDARVRDGPFRSDATFGNNGMFVFDLGGLLVQIIASDNLGWEHVSVCPVFIQRTLTWDEMCSVKDLFWDVDETVIQYHPAKMNYVNNHPFTLHLWKPVEQSLPVPPIWMTGTKDQE